MSSSVNTSFSPYTVIEEPLLEFGSSSREQPTALDPQIGLSNYGPFSSRLGGRWHPKKVRVVPVAARSDFEMVRDTLRRLGEFERVAEPSPYARIDYPGFESAFHTDFEVVEDSGTQSIDDAVFEEALAQKSAASGYRLVVETIGRLIEDLRLRPNDVVAAYLPPPIVKQFRSFRPDFRPVRKKQTRKKRDSRQMFLFEELYDEEGDSEEETLYHDLRRSIKVWCMRKEIATQIITDSFLTEDESQPWAGKFWNIGTSIFCKGGGVPWRLPTNENIAHCGIRFGISRDANEKSILVGLAQVFSASGELVALRAGTALKRSRAKSERGYHLSREQARDLISGALQDYEDVTGRLPNRLLIHKSSAFNDDERSGIEEAAAGVREVDLLFLKGTAIRLLPDRGQPADRGTIIPSSDTSAIVYVTGFIPSENAWRGKHVPTPVEIERFRSQRSLLDLGTELLRLTKMNWNTTIFATREPCTFTNASEMIGMMKELKPDETLMPHIRYYI